MTKMPNAEVHEDNNSEILRLLAHGEKEIEAGKGYDLDAVLAEADAVLRQMSCRKNPRST